MNMLPTPDRDLELLFSRYSLAVIRWARIARTVCSLEHESVSISRSVELYVSRLEETRMMREIEAIDRQITDVLALLEAR